MSAIIIGGNECMGRTYCDLCAKYNITGSPLSSAYRSKAASWYG